MKYSQIILGVFICIVLEFVIYNVNHKYHFFTPIFTTTPVVKEIVSGSSEMHSGTGKFTNPLLECSVPEDQGSIAQLNISKFELTNFVNNITTGGKVGFLSIYVRDLNGGPWVGINDDEQFIGGSLLKIPLLVAYMKIADSDPSILNKKITYRKKITSDVQYFGSQTQIQVGKTYTVEELLKYMVVYSDNNAAEILSAGLNQSDLDGAFTAVGLGQPNVNEPYIVDVQSYSGFFRILYNASYVSKNNSEKALSLLSQVEFNNGITAQLPKDIPVAHKFGIRTDGNLNQLHDCGIVYYPKHPYLLCIMSKNGQFPDLANAISDVSKFIYDQVSNSK